MYAGAYAFGKTEVHTNVIGGEPGRRRGTTNPGPLDRLDPESSPRLHFLGAVRTESIGVERECIHEAAHGPEVGPRRPQFIDRFVTLSPLRADAECPLQRTRGKLAVLPLSLHPES